MELKYGIRAFTPDQFQHRKPFDHIVLDDFFDPKVASSLSEEFPEFQSPVWHEYRNAIEIKKTCNDYNEFTPLTYALFAYLNSPGFLTCLETFTGISPLFPDPGLNGGGWHIHARGGKLNQHLDYNIHPKLGLQRKLNLIVYMNAQWQDTWGGELGFWSAKAKKKTPEDLIEVIVPKFNRAVLFDTTQNSWHGLVGPVNGPEGQCRKSIAIYYLTVPPDGEENRGKALFAPAKGQERDAAVLDLIRKRASNAGASQVYRS